jgi:murein L,D-transpeptidase YcbB/YkuD
MSLHRLKTFGFVALTYLSCSALQPATAQTFEFKQSVAQAAALDRVVHEFYKTRNYQSFWTGDTPPERSRLRALIKSFSEARLHGLPITKFNSETLISKILASTSFGAMGRLDVELTEKFLDYARRVQSGILIPSEVDEEIVRNVIYRDPAKILVALEAADAAVFFKSLPPQSVEYARLMKEKMRFERLVAVDAWGSEVAVPTLGPGASGAVVIGLRNRLINLGHMRRTFSATYDGKLKNAVRRFQEASGLLVTGVAGNLTIEQINVSATKRLAQIMVAMERERWLNQDLGDRHILVNLTDFTAKIMDFGKVTFQTNSVVGAHDDDRRSPEFSDTMEHMIVNPSWYVPRSIITNEYLPMLQMDPTAVDFLELRDDLGNVVDRAGLDFNDFDEETFPFGMRQPPSVGNALGLVKFMFPNRNNIYLHDTPAKSLFGREVRAFSHGCIRLENPFGFANALLAVQSLDPKTQFQEALDFGEEVQIDLNIHIPVHIIYRTAVTLPGGGLEFRRDIYGRDAKIWEALQLEGVVLSDFTG